ncbi:MAG: transcriptional regulator GlxA family with amidase domain [Psychromonas sp.]|jgi:transcriptional regulator GlxA family with amidase domain|uniref:GlxA family transcriptional regulator n=1 Tax=Psychromonas sp. TaxID=1884585 RepID=UPI0039E42902
MPNRVNSPQAVIRIALLAPQDCSLLSYGVISEVFILANQLLGVHKYHLSLLAGTDDDSTDDACTNNPSSKLFEKHVFSDQQKYDLLIVTAETPPETAVSIDIKKFLQRYYRQQTGQIIALKAGLWWLLDSAIGLDQAWVVHWSLMDDFKDRYPNVMLSHELYQQDGRLDSCAGQLATLDYLLAYLGGREEESLINQICDHLCLDRLRCANERQRLPNHAFGGEDVQPRLTMAVELMETNIEETLTTDQIAELVCLSRRQLERLFKRHMNTMPARHYLQIRLKRAHHLLQTSNMSIVQIGLSCGFSSGPHFSSSYKSFYQSTPREERTKCFANH